MSRRFLATDCAVLRTLGSKYGQLSRSLSRIYTICATLRRIGRMEDFELDLKYGD